MTPETKEKVEYRSKDVEHMRSLQEAIYEGNPNATPEQLERTWERIRKRVTMNDLHSYAIRLFNRNVLFPLSDCHKEIAVVFNNPVLPDEEEAVEKMMQAVGVPTDRLYFTHLNKVVPESEEEEKAQRVVLNSEIHIVHPSLILSFGVPVGDFGPNNAGGAIQNHKGAALMVTKPLPDEKEVGAEQCQLIKNEIWKDVQSLMSYYRM